MLVMKTARFEVISGAMRLARELRPLRCC